MLVENVHGQFLTPSVVGVLEDGQVLVGEPAKQLRVTHPERTASCFKRWMGSDRAIRLGSETMTSVELSSLVLRSLKADAEKFLGEEVDEAVITVPAYFNDPQRKATKVAGELTGLRVRRIINEPTAAALVYGFHERESEKDLIVIDLGGGTFDVTVMEVFEGTLEIVSTAGETHLGGEDFTSRLVGWALNQQGIQLEFAEMQHQVMVARLAEQCEAAKRALSSEGTAVIQIPSLEGSISEDAKKFKLNRAELLEIVNPLVQRLKRPIERALRDAGKKKSDLSDVILVGGATRSLEVRDFVRDMFPGEPHSKINPDEVVALGASIQAALIADDAAVDDMVMTDICPFTMGVEVVKEFGSRMMEGFFCPVIHRNTTIPVSREEFLSTVYPNQQRVVVNVYQGEARKIEDNLLLGSLEVSGIPLGPAGQMIHIRFTYDHNGILEVEAYIPETEKKFNVVFTNHAADMNAKEVAAAVKKLQKIKFYPRDELKHKNLVLYAEKVIGEVSPFQRQELEIALDCFEQSMSSGNPELFEHARNGLLIVLSSMGFPFETEDE